MLLKPGTGNREPGTGNGERKSGNECTAVIPIRIQSSKLFPVGARLTKGLRTRELSYGTCESAGEEAKD